MIVRPAVAGDIPALVAMARAEHAFSEQPWTFDEARAAALTRGLIASPLGFVHVAADGAGAAGVLAAAFVEHPMAGFIYGEEIMFWIEPRARGGSAAGRLIAAFETNARSRGCGMIKLSNMTGPTSAGVAALFERRGFSAREQSFLKAL